MRYTSILAPVAVAAAAVAWYVLTGGARCGAAIAGTRVLITGASSGIGAELANQYGAAGAHVIIAARREDRLAEVCARIRARGGSCAYRATDMRNTTDVEMLVTFAESVRGGIDTLVLNHAAVDDALIVEQTAAAAGASLRDVLQTNVVGSAVAAIAALPALQRAGGHITVVSSAVSAIPGPFHAAYAASKRALHGYFDTMRAELEFMHSNVTIGLHVLGMIATPEVMANPGNAKVAMPVQDCARDMIRASVCRVSVAYVPEWYRYALVAFRIMGDRAAMAVMWHAYLSNDAQYMQRLQQAETTAAGAERGA